MPFSIILYCKEYNLAKIVNEKYILCLTQILTGNSINLFFKNYIIDEELNCVHKKESLEKKKC